MKIKKKNDITKAEALEKVKEIMLRIDKAKGKIRAEYEAVDNEISRRRSGEPSISISEQGFKKVDDFYRTDAELLQVRNKLKEALDIPYYADAEFRKYSLIYLELVTEEAEAEYEDVDRRREENHQKRIECSKVAEKLSAERREIGGKCANAYREIGLGKFGHTAIHGAPGSNFNDYKEYCEKYGK